MQLGSSVWSHIAPGFTDAITSTYVDALGIKPEEMPQDLVRRERRKLELLLAGDFGSEFEGILAQVVADNIAAGLDYKTYLVGYGIYAGYLVRALEQNLDADDPTRDEKVRFLLRQTHTEASMAIGHFFRHIEEAAQAERETLASTFEERVMSRLATVESTLDQVSTVSTMMKRDGAAAGESASASAQRVAEVTERVGAVASTTHGLSSAAQELAQQVQNAAENATTLRRESTTVQGTVEALQEESAKIGGVVRMIRSIADQIRMLALNATIEAARAGNAGRGFAVVAGEVKALASDTSNALDRISERVDAIRKNTDTAGAAFGAMGTAVEMLDELTGSIAAVGEEQSASTSEIAHNSELTAADVRSLAADVQGMADFAQSAATTSDDIERKVAGAREAADVLRQALVEFVGTIRSPAGAAKPRARAA